MAILKSSFKFDSADARKNRKKMQALIAELEQRRATAALGGSKEEPLMQKIALLFKEQGVRLHLLRGRSFVNRKGLAGKPDRHRLKAIVMTRDTPAFRSKTGVGAL